MTPPARFECATPWFVARYSDPLSYGGMSRCPSPARRERERRPNGGSRVILRSRATLRRPTTRHLVDASTSSTACISSAAFLPGPSLVKKRLLHLHALHAAPEQRGIRKRQRPTWHSAQVGRSHRSRIRNGSSYSIKYDSPHPILHRSFLTRIDRRARFCSPRRSPARTLVCRDTLAHRDHRPSHRDPIQVRNHSRTGTRLSPACRMARPAARLHGACQ